MQKTTIRVKNEISQRFLAWLETRAQGFKTDAEFLRHYGLPRDLIGNLRKGSSPGLDVAVSALISLNVTHEEAIVALGLDVSRPSTPEAIAYHAREILALVGTVTHNRDTELPGEMYESTKSDRESLARSIQAKCSRDRIDFDPRAVRSAVSQATGIYLSSWLDTVMLAEIPGILIIPSEEITALREWAR